jgi:hypothetical protein
MFSKLKVRTILTRVFGPLEPGENAIGIDVSPEELEAIFVRLSGDDRLLCVNLGRETGFQLRVYSADSEILREQRLSENCEERLNVLLNFHNRTGLWLEHLNLLTAEHQRRPVNRLEQLDELVTEIKTEQALLERRTLRRLEVAEANQQELGATFCDLASRKKMTFRIGHDVADAKLSLRVLGRKAGFHLSFPVGMLEAMSGNAPDLVETLESFSKLGIKFRSNNRRWVAQQSEWIVPDSNVESQESC